MVRNLAHFGAAVVALGCLAACAREVAPAPSARSEGNASGPAGVMEAPVPEVPAPQRYVPPTWEYAPKIAAASDEAAAARAGVRVPQGMALTLWAAEPELANPVAFDVAADGRVYVAETFRQETEGVPDNRTFPEFLENDLRTVTVEQRGENYLASHPEFLEQWTDQEERIRVLWDEDGDGRADVSRVFARGFNDLLDGTGAGVLAVGADVFFTCIPKLWKLTDTDRDGVAEDGLALHHGYGPRIAFRGHDLHGLVIGPDERLYFSVGDRGYHVLTQEGEWLSEPGRGAVFRCELDGSGLEVFAHGLRNPQELAFDDYGNLFTVDNNCDAGDRARLIYLVEGGDSGWSMNFQYLGDRGPWMPEAWWKPRDQVEDQAAFLNPPLANVTSGPSGFVHYPGVGLPDKYANSFFICDFTGGSGSSGIRRLVLEPDGAGFRLAHQEEFLWGMLTTDVAFGPDGALWALDWVAGWVGEGKGRIWRGVFDEARSDLARETATLLAADLTTRSDHELLALLAHPDRRVRQQAQRLLGERGLVDLLLKLALGTGDPQKLVDAVIGAAWLPYAKPQLARIHAIWALTRMQRVAALAPLLTDEDPELRAQAARAFGEAGDVSQVEALLQQTAYADPRVRYQALRALGKLGSKNLTAAELVITAVLDSATSKDFEDPWLRHALAMALASLPLDADYYQGIAIANSKGDQASRLALLHVLAARLREFATVSAYLEYEDPRVATEAARAIWDRRIVGAYAALADQAARAHELTQPHARRALAAANHLGRAADAAAIHAYLQRADVDPKLKEDCIEYVREWTAPKEFDRVLNESFTHPEPRARDAFAGKELGFLTRQELDTVARGEKVFREHLKATCTKCHSVGGSAISAAANEAGPDLSNVGLRLTTAELRQSILEPTATIAAGFEKYDAAGALVKESAMTAGLGAVLTGAELDDLVAFLAQQQRVRRILIHVESAGFEHSVAKAAADGLSLVERQWRAWDESDPRFEVVVDRGWDWATADRLAQLDAVFFYTTGELAATEPQRRALMDWIRAGGGFSGSHCASDTFYQWEEYGRMVGGYFDGHPWHEEVGVRVENRSHVATRHFEWPTFRVTDEIYQHKAPWSRDTSTVLLSLDVAATDMEKGGIHRADRDFGLAWTRREGEGRVFYTAFGHREDVWESAWFRDHLVAGTLWTAE